MSEEPQGVLPISFFVPLTPTGKARARAGRNGHYTPRKTKAAEEAVAMFCRAAMRMHKRDMFLGPVALDVTFELPIPASWSKKDRAAALNGSLRPTSKPDLSNMVKLIEDAMNGIAFKDDSQICEGTSVKRYAETPRIYVIVRPL